MTNIDLDETDRRILDLLQANNQLTNLELAEKLALSPPTALRRVRRLREAQVIARDVSLVDPDALGVTLFAFVEIVLDRQTEALQKAFETKMAAAPEVMECYMVAGHIDFMLLVQVRDMAAYHRFARETLAGDENIRNFRTLFSMHRSKYETALPVAP